MSGGERVTRAMVTTRARKRKVGERDSLWDLVEKNDDISLTHIVPRLNQILLLLLSEDCCIKVVPEDNTCVL